MFSDFFLVSDTAVGGHSRWAPYGATAVIDTTHGYYRDSLNVGRAGAPGYIRLNNGGGKTRLYSSSNPGEDFLFSFPRNNGTGITDGDTVNQRAFSDLRYGQLGAENTWLYTQYGNWQGSLYGNVSYHRRGERSWRLTPGDGGTVPGDSPESIEKFDHY